MMQDTDKILSQNEIDAMLSGGGGATVPAPEPGPAPVAPPAAAPVAPPFAAPVAAPAAPPTQIQGVQAIPAGAPAPAPDAGQLQNRVQALGEQLQALTSQVEGIMAGLQATVGYNAQGTFSCKSCSSQGQVAARLTCTSCGTEDWWGWFPPQQ